MKRTRSTTRWIALGLMTIGVSTPAWAGDAQINVKYVTVAARPLPADISVISVQKPTYLHRASDDGIMRGKQQRWYNLLVGRLQSKFRQAAPHISVVNVEDRAITYNEALSRQLDGADPEGPSARKAKSSDAVIVARFVFSAPYCETFREKISLHERAGKSIARRIPLIGGSIDNPRYRVRYRIRVNVSCKIEMIHTRTDETLASYARDIETSQITDQGVFGLGYGGRELFELDTVETQLSSIIEEHVDNFLAQIVPVHRSLTKHLKHVNHRLAQAVEKLNAGNTKGAVDQAFRAWGRDKKSHQACFVIGLAWELRAWQRKAEWSYALSWYSRALERKSDDRDYQDALARVRAAAGAQSLAGR